MIAQVHGKLIDVTEGTALIAYGSGPEPSLVLSAALPAYLATRLVLEIGRPVTLHTRLTLETQTQGASFHPRLTGFESASDRDFFELFTSVRGLGGKRALKALIVSPAEIAGAIQAKDAKALQKLPEIGKRLAETVIAELHGKVDPFIGPGAEHQPVPPVAAAGTPAERDAVDALVALGQSPADAERMVAQAMAARPADAAEPTADDLISLAFGQPLG